MYPNYPSPSKHYSSELIKSILIILFISIACSIKAQQKVIPLYTGPAPGSENWDWEEKEFFVKTPLNAKVAYNVTKPTLTVFAPDSANGIAVILFPGGNYHVLNIETEGSNVAKELNKKGITAFLFKYRLTRSLTDDPWVEMMNSMKDSVANRKKTAPAREFAIADAKKAMEYVRQHAAEYKIDPKKIGVVGFSAGGGLAVNLSINEKEDIRPNFAGFIYSIFRPEYNAVPSNAPPVFIAGSTDDQLAPPINSINLYNAWITAKNSAELHIYSKGSPPFGHGFSRTTGPFKNWLFRFEEWLISLGFINSAQ